MLKIIIIFKIRGDPMAIQNIQAHALEHIQKEKAKIAFHADIYKLAQNNTDYRHVIETGEYSQLVLMSLNPGEEIGEEIHKADQILIFVEGSGKAIINDREFSVNEQDLVFVKAGSKHNFINTGSQQLKLFTIYAPSQHRPHTIEKNKTAYSD